MKDEIRLFIQKSRGFSFWSRQWFEFDNWKVYLRKWKIYVNNELVDCIQIATVEAYKKRKWFFTNIVTTCEELRKEYWLWIYVENCLYDFLWTSLEKRWFSCIHDDSVSKSYFKK